MEGRKTGGRKAGTPNKMTAEIAILCAPMALQSSRSLFASHSKARASKPAWGR